MPYFIEQGCDGKPEWWAVKDVAGEQFGCHATKQGAIDQGIAISLADDEEFLGENKDGERAAPDLSAPQFMREAASQGLKYLDDGFGGDGLTPKTIREARLMAAGDMSADKWVRVAAWIARHLPDLDSPAADPDSEDYPSAGVVAHLLWGSGPSKEAATRALEYAQRKVAQLEAEGSQRNLDGADAIISDIDGTLIASGRLVQRVWDYVQELDGELFIVTGRPDSERDSTEAELKDLGISYSRLIMNDGSPADSAEFKKLTAVKLLETYNVTTAIENDRATRAKYRALGINAVNPSDIKDNGSMTERSEQKFETRVSAADFEIRETPDGMTFEGYAAVFNSRSENLGGFTEFVAPGAFTRSLKTRNDVKLLWNHDSGQVLGSTRARTLTLSEDSRGLKVTAQLPNTQLGRDTAELLKRGDVDAMSFGFNVIKDSWNSQGDERTLEAVRLFEVSIVAFPAYSATSGTATVRSLENLVTRAEVDAVALEAALTKLEAGEDLDNDARNLLTTVIDKLSPAAEFQADPEPTVIGDLGLLALKKKKIEFLGGI